MKKAITARAAAAAFVLCVAASGSASASIRMDPQTMKAAKFGKTPVAGTPNKTMKIMGTKKGKINLSSWKIDGSLEYVHGMYYLAKTKKGLTAKAADEKGGKVKLKKGEKLLVIYFPTNRGKTVCRLKNGRTVYVPATSLTVTNYVYNSSKAYSDAQIEEWMNSRGITSKSNYAFFASKFNQRGWILVKSGGKWRCRYVLGISTGAYTNGGRPNDCYSFNSCSINTHYVNKKGFGKGISYASKAGGNQIHVSGRTLRPGTHGCIGMKRKDYEFVYWRLPYGTRVVLF